MFDALVENIADQGDVVVRIEDEGSLTEGKQNAGPTARLGGGVLKVKEEAEVLLVDSRHVV